MAAADTTTDVFLSYNHQDDTEHGHAFQVAEALRKAGYTVWWDRDLLVGEDWHAKIHRQMNAATRIVALISRRMLESSYCEYELNYATATRKLVPVLLEPLTPADFPGDLARSVPSLNWVMLDDEGSFDRIVSAIGVIPSGQDQNRAYLDVFADERIMLPSVMTSGEGRLVGRASEEALLTQAWAGCLAGVDPSQKTNIVVLHAIGGAGKTALLRRFVDILAERNFDGADRVIGWSAYSQGSGENRQADVDAFFTETLRRLGFSGDLPRDAVRRAELLSAQLRQSRCLLLLDGIEPLQSAPNVNRGRLKDRGLQRLVQDLSISNPGLVVITSRQPLPELESRAAPLVLDIALEALSPQAGAELLQHHGCYGTEQELADAAVAVGCHALSLTLLGSFLSATEGGDIRRSDAIKLDNFFDLTASSDASARQADAIMQSYLERFESLASGQSRGKGLAEKMLLSIVGLFNRPAPGEAVERLLDGDPIAGLTDEYATWTRQQKRARIREACSRLRALKLLASEDPADPASLDAHPIVRAYFGYRLEEDFPDAFRQAHQRLEAYYAAQAPEQANSLSQMQPLLHAISHACAAGDVAVALNDYYWTRMHHGNAHYIQHQLGAYSTDLVALANFFSRCWSEVDPTISEPGTRSILLGQAASNLRALGRLVEARPALREAYGLDLARKDSANAARSALALADLDLLLGDVHEASAAALSALDLANRAIDGAAIIESYCLSGQAARLKGSHREALMSFFEAEARWRNTGVPTGLEGRNGRRFHDLLLDLGWASEVDRRGAENLQSAVDQSRPMMQAFAQWSIGDAATEKAWLTGQEHEFSRAAEAYDAAIESFRRSDSEVDLPALLSARAGFYRKRAIRLGKGADIANARAELVEACEISARCGLQAQLARAFLEMAECALCAIPGSPSGDLIMLRDDIPDASAMIKISRPGMLGRVFGLGRRKQATGGDELAPELAPGPPVPPLDGLANTDRGQAVSTVRTYLDKASQIIDDCGLEGLSPQVQSLQSRLATSVG